MTTARHLVVVARAQPLETDELADLLRDAFTVRTAYSTAEVLDRLEPAVDVVLVDPDLSENAVEDVRDAVVERDLDCQVGLLSPGPAGSHGVDAVIQPTAPDREVRDRVEHLVTRARYRKTLEEYYDLARTSAELHDASAERERLEKRLEHLGRHLDDVAEPLDATTLFRAALDSDRMARGELDGRSVEREEPGCEN